MKQKVLDLLAQIKTKLELDTWICNTGASTHMYNTDEGMFDCMTYTN